MYETLVNTIVNYVEVAPENITADSRLVEDLGLTSFDIMCMLGNWRIPWMLKLTRRKR